MDAGMQPRVFPYSETVIFHAFLMTGQAGDGILMICSVKGDERMEALISKWHRELAIFSSIKPMIIFEGNVLDQYRYPEAGSLKENTVVPLSRYLHTWFADHGYDQIVFYSNLVGFINPYEPEMLTRYAALTSSEIKNGAIQAEFKGTEASTAPNVIRRAMSQQKAATVTILEVASHYITTPDRMDQQDVNSFNILMQSAQHGSGLPRGRNRIC